jgi:hypothetical protein
VRTLSLRQLNRTTLLRQLLLRRERLSPARAIARVGALQAQWAPSPYLALWARLEGFRREQLESALRRDTVLKATLMRATLHLVAARDYPFFAAAVREAQTTARVRGVPPPKQALIEQAATLARERPVTRRELLTLLGHPDAKPRLDVTPFRKLHWVLVEAHLEQTPDSALWIPARVNRFRGLDIDFAPLDEANAHLIRRYLGAFGPVTRADISQWSGVPIGKLAAALESLPLRRFRDENGRELLDLPRAHIAEADVPAPVRFLPRWDELLLAHDRRERVLPDEFRKTVIAKNGDVQETFLVDGFVAGTWSLDSGRVKPKPFAPLPRTARREVEDEAKQLEAWLR